MISKVTGCEGVASVLEEGEYPGLAVHEAGEEEGGVAGLQVPQAQPGVLPTHLDREGMRKNIGRKKCTEERKKIFQN